MSLHLSIATSTADCYISVATADDYFEKRELSTSWDNISINSTGTLGTTERKERLLKQATREIDQAFNFVGSKYYTYPKGDTNYQSLQFPRNSDYDVDGNLYIPDEVQYATCEQALWIMERGGKKTTNEGTVIERQLIGDEVEIYLKDYITRQVQCSGKWWWR